MTEVSSPRASVMSNVRADFGVFDTGQCDGYITRDDFIRVMLEAGRGWSTQDAEEKFDVLDHAKNGRVHYEEFGVSWGTELKNAVAATPAADAKQLRAMLGRCAERGVAQMSTAEDVERLMGELTLAEPANGPPDWELELNKWCARLRNKSYDGNAITIKTEGARPLGLGKKAIGLVVNEHSGARRATACLDASTRPRPAHHAPPPPLLLSLHPATPSLRAVVTEVGPKGTCAADAGVKRGDVVHTCCNLPVGKTSDIALACGSVADDEPCSWVLTRKVKQANKAATPPKRRSGN